MKSILAVLVLVLGLNATRLSDFADSIPVGTWALFPTPTLTAAMIASPPSGTSLAYNQQAVWDSATHQLMNIGAAHGSGMTRAFVYDASMDVWRNIATAREPATSANRQSHSWDMLTYLPDSGVAYYATFTGLQHPDSTCLFRYRFAADKWDSMQARFPGGAAVDYTYIYAGSMEYVPEWHGLAMIGGDNGRGSFLDLTAAVPVWADFPALSGSTVHSILDYNPVSKTLLNLDQKSCKIVNASKQARAIKLPPFSTESYYTKVTCEPLTGTHVAFFTSNKKLFAYEPDRDLWQEIAAGGESLLAGVNNAETIIFKIKEYGIIGIISNEPRCLIYKYTTKLDTLLTDLNAAASKSSIEEMLDTASLTVTATRPDNSRDTVTRSCFFVSLDTLVATVLPGGRVVPTLNSLRGPARIEVIKNTAKGTWRDTVVITVVNTSAALDSLVLDRHSLTLMPGDRYPLTLMAYYHMGPLAITRLVDAEDVWETSDASVALVKRAAITGMGQGRCTIYARLASGYDSVNVVVQPRPLFLKRIDFRGTAADNAHILGWNEDYGEFGRYDDNRRGFGFTDGPAGSWSTMADQTNYLIAEAIAPDSRVGTYKIMAADGEYVVRAAIRYANSWVAFGSDTLCKAADDYLVIKTDTIAVSGGNSAVFSINGTLSYLILLSKDGTDMDSAAWDQMPLTFIGDSAFKALDNSGNIALGKTATQSSTYGGTRAAERAVDGNTDGNDEHGSVADTYEGPGQWWMVDLGRAAAISRIRVFGRTDCCTERLSDYTVSLLDESQAVVWSNVQSVFPNPSVTIDAQQNVGRYVKIALNGSGYLSLAEVQVFEADYGATGIALAKKRAASFSCKLLPNPFNPVCSIVLTLPEAMNVGMTVFDIRGRSIKSIKPSRFEAGTQRLAWDATDESGAKATTGVYFYRLTAGAKTMVLKGILAK